LKLVDCGLRGIIATILGVTLIGASKRCTSEVS
jgi:hypothetical protein